MPSPKITIGNVEIISLSDGVLEFDLCNFFPDLPAETWELVPRTPHSRIHNLEL